ncbi:hypothetical protein PVAP13_9KG099213 [Panicum virgatum]|uniref:Uncharacterized protein n=1 Tax=Panicum virgatum TaxID=38727 RepID=A0A8T0NM74_PANVG|nr:hypothetical protein PVAP13_9KG099213 [Panicum virgatum]
MDEQERRGSKRPRLNDESSSESGVATPIEHRLHLSDITNTIDGHAAYFGYCTTCCTSK